MKQNDYPSPQGLAPESGEQLDAYATSGSSPPKEETKLLSLYLTAAEAAAYLRISIQTLYNLRSKGRLRGINRGGIKHAHLLFTRPELEEFLRGRPVSRPGMSRNRRVRKAG